MIGTLTTKRLLAGFKGMLRNRILGGSLLCLLLTGVLAAGVHLPGASACSSFAVYGEQTYFGSNFDFDLGTEVRFTLQEAGGEQLFLASFRQGMQWLDVMGYNTAGLFATLQMVPPKEARVQGQPTMMVPQLMAVSLFGASSVDDVLDYLGNARLVPVPGFYLHSLYADTTGRALVVEAGETANYVQEMDGTYLGMTNFYHQDWEEADLTPKADGGMDRYLLLRDALGELKENDQFLDVESALAVLQSVAQGANTLASTVVDPVAQMLYLVIDADYSRVWQVDLVEQTIAAWRGLDDQDVRPFPRRGVAAADLRQWH